MKVCFRGVRGSIPVPGPATVRYGGNSSCLEVRADEGPPLVLDGGTGMRTLGRDLITEGHRHIHVLFSHFHADHIFGFPFFGPLYSPSTSIDVGLQARGPVEAEARLGTYLAGTYHPVRLGDVPARLRFRGVMPGRTFDMGPYRVTSVSLNHPGGALGYRITVGRRTVVYLTDTAPLSRPGHGLPDGEAPPPPEQRVVEAMAEADLVVMDTMFSYEEYLEKMTWGHAYPEYAVALAEAAGARRLALFHHSPDADDASLDRLADRWAQHQGALQVWPVRDGEAVHLGED